MVHLAVMRNPQLLFPLLSGFLKIHCVHDWTSVMESLLSRGRWMIPRLGVRQIDWPGFGCVFGNAVPKRTSLHDIVCLCPGCAGRPLAGIFFDTVSLRKNNIN